MLDLTVITFKVRFLDFDHDRKILILEKEFFRRDFHIIHENIISMIFLLTYLWLVR
jgi:hypothetical protein